MYQLSVSMADVSTRSKIQLFSHINAHRIVAIIRVIIMEMTSVRRTKCAKNTISSMIGELDAIYRDLSLHNFSYILSPFLRRQTCVFDLDQRFRYLLPHCSSSVLMIQLSEFDAHPSIGSAPTLGQIKSSFLY